VGINTAILAPSGGNVGIGFSIPINMVRQLTRQLVEHGRVERGRLGVYIQDLTPELAQAWQNELRENDVITSVNRIRITNLDEFSQVVSASGDLLFSIQRGQRAFFLAIR
jgi:S1-C subfamily serine protease